MISIIITMLGSYPYQHYKFFQRLSCSTITIKLYCHCFTLHDTIIKNIIITHNHIIVMLMSCTYTRTVLTRWLKEFLNSLRIHSNQVQ